MSFNSQPFNGGHASSHGFWSDSIEFTRPARKELERLPTKDRVRVTVAIDLLSENPRPPRCRPVQDAPKGTYRIRVGDYRVIYTIQDDVLLIAVVRIRRRNESTYNGIA